MTTDDEVQATPDERPTYPGRLVASVTVALAALGAVAAYILGLNVGVMALVAGFGGLIGSAVARFQYDWRSPQ